MTLPAPAEHPFIKGFFSRCQKNSERTGVQPTGSNGSELPPINSISCSREVRLS